MGRAGAEDPFSLTVPRAEVMHLRLQAQSHPNILISPTLSLCVASVWVFLKVGPEKGLEYRQFI